MIYFLQVAEHGPIKIGFTGGSIGWRIKYIQAGSPHELVVLGIHEGGRNTEQELHKRFAHLRIRSEWFRPSAELVGYIAENSSLKKLMEIERDDLKRMISRENRRLWTACERKIFNERSSALVRDFSDWMAGFKPAPQNVVRMVETFLSERESGAFASMIPSHPHLNSSKGAA